MSEADAVGKATNVTHVLRAEIMSGKLKPGSALPTQRQLGTHYGVAEGTASKAVTQLKKEGLVERIPRRGSFVARRLPRKYQTLDLVRTANAPGVPLRTSALAWIEQFSSDCKRRGWTARWHHLMADDPKEVEILANTLTDSRGVIVFHVRRELLWMLHPRGIPVVGVSLLPTTHDFPSEGYPQIAYDHCQAGRIAADHLLQLGYRRIALIGLVSSPLRMIGFQRAAAARQLIIPAQLDVVAGGFAQESGSTEPTGASHVAQQSAAASVLLHHRLSGIHGREGGDR